MQMTKPIVYLITVVACAFFQVAISPAISIAGCAPNFLLIPVLLIALRSGAAAGSVAGFACGLFEDFAGNGTVGCMALTFTIVGLAVGFVASALETTGGIASCLVGTVASFLAELVYGIANALTSSAGGGIAITLLTHSLPTALYTAVFVCIALATIRLVLVDDTPSMPSRLSSGTGRGSSIYSSRLR